MSGGGSTRLVSDLGCGLILASGESVLGLRSLEPVWGGIGSGPIGGGLGLGGWRRDCSNKGVPGSTISR